MSEAKTKAHIAEGDRKPGNEKVGVVRNESAVTFPDTSGRYNNGKLTREGAIEVIKEGGSVSLTTTDENGKVTAATYSRVEDLPDEADFARGDEAAEAAALENLHRQREATDAQIARLSARKGKAAAEKK